MKNAVNNEVVVSEEQIKQQKAEYRKETRKKYKKSISFLWEYIKQYKEKFIIVVITSLLISLLNVGVIIGEYYFMKYAQDHWKDPTQTDQINIVIFTISLLITIVTIIGLYILQTVLMTRIAQYVGKQIRKDLYFKILDLKLQYFDTNPSGDIMSRLTNDINNITNALTQNVTQFLINSTQIIMMLIAIILFAPILSVVLIVIAPIQLTVILMLFKKAQPNFMKKQVALGDINGFIEETISGQKVINNFNKQDKTIRDFDVKNEHIRKIDYSTQTLSNLVNPWNTFIGSITIALMFIVGFAFAIHNINFGGIVSTVQNGKTSYIGVLSITAAVLSFTKNYINPIYQIFQMLYLLQGAIAGTERAFVIKDQQNEVMPKLETNEVSQLKGNIEFKNLCFSYDGKKEILKNIDLKVKAGQVVGIVGPTGSGKTTIINLLTKFYDLTNKKSDIIIDGHSIKEMTKKSLRDEISIVLQDTFIFGETIYENLRYANPNATNEEIEQAAQEANAHHFIMSLKDGYNTILENNADSISQGEKQLLAISRAFLKKSSILILDEATSSIDTKTEKDIQSGMIKLSKGKTTFMIAHRLSTIKHADIIVVLKDGQILEQGNHEQLLKKGGFYANMYNSKLNTPEDVEV